MSVTVVTTHSPRILKIYVTPKAAPIDFWLEPESAPGKKKSPSEPFMNHFQVLALSLFFVSL